MWKPDQFDASLIDHDLARAADIGLDGVRIFIQTPLAEQITQGDWWRMDTVLDIAERRSLSLLVTLSDFPESDLWNRATIAGTIAHRYAGRSVIAGYDLKNEPQIGDLVTALFPRTDELDPDGWKTLGSDTKRAHPRSFRPAIQTDAVIRQYGESIPRDSALAWRAMKPDWLPERLSDDEAYWAINALLTVDVFQSEYRAWTGASPGTTVVDYLDQAEHHQRWSALVDLIDESLGYWIDAHAAPLWREQPSVPITVGFNDLLMATRPANQALDMVSFHQYHPADDSAPDYSVQIGLEIARRTGTPTVLGEFGWSTHEVEPHRAAELETATFEAAREAGLSGAYKWMLNDATNQPNAREAAFGLFRVDGTAKPSAEAIRQLDFA